MRPSGRDQAPAVRGSVKVGIYLPHWHDFGGSEYVVALAGATLARAHEVEILHHRDRLSKAEVERAFGVDLARVAFRRIAPTAPRPAHRRNPLGRLRADGGRSVDFTAPYDLFINHSHNLPLHCRARRGIFICPFPMHVVKHPAGRAPAHWIGRPRWFNKAVESYRWHELHRRLGSYDDILANSEFTRGWIRRRWGVDSGVLYPPAHIQRASAPKERILLCVSRLAPDKKVEALIQAYARLCRNPALRGWRFVIAGGSAPDQEATRYLDRLTDQTRGLPIELLPNVAASELRDLYGRASIFWHAKGYDESPIHHPERMEHFGIVTVEAMGAGCVPVVFGAGGQSEIVTDGTDGRTWRTLEELERHTLDLVTRPELRRALSVAARSRAGEFSEQRFAERLLARIRRVCEAEASA